MPASLDIFGQLWKEYSLSDSRYLTQDSFIVCMETVTALFWGPLSFACAYCIVAGHPLRHPLQLVISLGQLYGDVLYFATCSFEELVAKIVYCRPEEFYYWCYYVFFNAFWIVIPFYLIIQSCVETKRAFEKAAVLEKGSRSKKNM
ncbi:putative emopamil binding protein [Colletotrichum sublineola]|uniref:Putative emopamil binding protein n=1 Tax=Colletotrichum sublineola TaxID=1173701 RepID=A0A066X1Y5_COLSU|nr:putative emopamil binding protein [Colletotrichum sublineola]